VEGWKREGCVCEQLCPLLHPDGALPPLPLLNHQGGGPTDQPLISIRFIIDPINIRIVHGDFTNFYLHEVDVKGTSMDFIPKIGDRIWI
jgi:hypothetical protein